ncbi:hypothetical protein [Agromyces soli]|uniref:Protein kinase domain-containing protein n=1 Tax=Agromyces soli TaxID=659012 RepID=A0ABY4AUM3_9MICO|nr:hypothetical protein [Agromyces soli]UOE25536.1 hypothetical protein MTP13_14525 [Agromyces soli]
MEQQTQQTRRGRRARGRTGNRRSGGPTVAAAAPAPAPLAAEPGIRPLRSPWAASSGEPPAGEAVVSGGCLGGYRLLRRIGAGARAQVFLVRPEFAASPDAGLAGPEPVEQAMALRVYDEQVDQGTVTIELEALDALGGGTLPAISDVFTSGRTVCLVVEAVTGRRLSNLLDERRLAPGEAVTVLAPIAAAVRELARCGFAHPQLSAADVRFDAAGRPRITGLGQLQRLGPASAERTALERRAHEALVGLVELVAGATHPAPPLQRVVELARARLSARPFESFALDVEHALFQVATAVPVIGAGEDRPARAPVRRPPLHGNGTLEPVHEPPSSSTSASAERVRSKPRARERDEAGDRSGGLGELLAAETPVLELLRTGRWRSWLGDRLARRRSTIVVGALVAAAASVLLLTLVPPERGESVERGPGSPFGAAEDAPSPVPTTSTPEEDRAEAGAEPLEADAAPLDEPDALVAAAAELLADRASCLAAADRQCLGQVVQPGSALERSDLAELAGERPVEQVPYDLDAVVVVGTMGGAVLLEVPVTGAEREPASLLMIRSEAGWRLREIFD